MRKPIRERIENRITKAPVPRSWKRAIWRRQINAKYEPHFEAMKEQNADWNDINQLNGEWFRELEELEEEVQIELTQTLTRQAEKYHLAVPPHSIDNIMWVTTEFSEQTVLSDTGVKTLRAEIRTEQKWRRESWAFRITIVSAITGLLGTATGLVALLKH